MPAVANHHLESLFDEIADLPPAERSAALDERCAGANTLRGQVEQLLAHDDAGSSRFLASPVDQLPAPLDLGPGTMIGDRYRIIERVGEGGMGIVYRAQQQQPVRREVAVKIIKPGLDSREVLARFERERQTLAELGHPNIARMIDAGLSEDGRPYVVMDFVDGLPITTYCDRRRLGVRERLDLFLGVCRAIQHAHQNGVIHRDIKPTNVLVRLAGDLPVPTVIDFGVAKAGGHHAGGQTVYTGCGQILGTPAYMSPEQAELTNRHVDTRSDIYSLGVLLYELLCGTSPLAARTSRRAAFDEICRSIREDEPERPSARIANLDAAALADIAHQRRVTPPALRRCVRGDLDWIAMKALEKDPARRYASAAALAADVRRHLRDEPVLAGPPSPFYRIGKLVRRHRAAVMAAMLVVAILVAGVVTATTLAVGEARARSAERDARLAEQTQRERADARANEAQWAAARAEAISLFLEDMLRSARSSSRRGRDVTMREVLDMTSEKLAAGALAGRPGVEEQVRGTIGASYYELGLYESAVPHERWRLEYLDAARGSDDPQTIRAMRDLGAALNEAGETEAAHAIFERMLDRATRVHGEGSELACDAMNNLGNTLMRLRRPAEAERYHLAALQAIVARHGADHPRTVLARFNLGADYRDQDRLDDALAMYQQALATLCANGESASVTAVRIRWHIARDVHARRRHFAKAESLLQETLAIARPALGDDHPETITVMIQLGDLFFRAARPSEAWPIYAEALERRRATFGEESAEVAWMLLHLAHRQEADGRRDAAATNARAALVRFEALGNERYVEKSRRAFEKATASSEMTEERDAAL